MVFSLLKFKSLVKTMQLNRDFFAKERLMIVHLLIFLIYIVAIFGYCFTAKEIFVNNVAWWNQVYPDPACRFLITNTFFNVLISVTNSTMIILFTYLSVRFSEPLEDYRAEFLLLF